MGARRSQAPKVEIPSPERSFDVPSPGWSQHGDSLHLFQGLQTLTRTVGELNAKVDRLIDDVDRSGAALQAVEKELIRGRAILSTLAVTVPAVGILLWWLIGDRIERAKDDILDSRPSIGHSGSTQPAPKPHT